MMARVAWFVLVALFLAPSRSATAAPEPARMTAAGAFFALSVPDLQASSKWYSEKLGLKVVVEPPKSDKTAVVVLEGDGIIVELIQHDDAQPLTKVAPKVESTILVHGVFKTGIVVQDLDQVIALLKQRGVPIAIGPFPAQGKQKANLIIRDNAGNLIQFVGK